MVTKHTDSKDVGLKDWLGPRGQDSDLEGTLEEGQSLKPAGRLQSKGTSGRGRNAQRRRHCSQLCRDRWRRWSRWSSLGARKCRLLRAHLTLTWRCAPTHFTQNLNKSGLDLRFHKTGPWPCYLHRRHIGCADRQLETEAAGRGQSPLSRETWTCPPLLHASDLLAWLRAGTFLPRA